MGLNPAKSDLKFLAGRHIPSRLKNFIFNNMQSNAKDAENRLPRGAGRNSLSQRFH
jgi:hypothetical protein